MEPWSKSAPTDGRLSASRVAKLRHLSADPAKVSAFLRAEHPHKTAEACAAATGMSLAAARKLLEREGAPSFGTMVRLIMAYGPRFLVAVMPTTPETAWLDEAARRAERDAILAERDALARRLEQLDRLERRA